MSLDVNADIAKARRDAKMGNKSRKHSMKKGWLKSVIRITKDMDEETKNEIYDWIEEYLTDDDDDDDDFDELLNDPDLVDNRW